MSRDVEDKTGDTGDNVTTSVAKVARVRPPKKKYYSVRMELELIDRCKAIAAAETQRQGFPVATAAVLCKFIRAGADAWDRGEKSRG